MSDSVSFWNSDNFFLVLLFLTSLESEVQEKLIFQVVKCWVPWAVLCKIKGPLRRKGKWRS